MLPMFTIRNNALNLQNLLLSANPSIERFCADAGYCGTFVLDVDKLLGLGVDISENQTA
jgi:hypothetical protein